MNATGPLPVVANEFFLLAAAIVRDTTSGEAALRTAISRAYYSVFLTARDQLFGTDGALLTNSVRKALQKKFLRRHRRHPGSHDDIVFAISEIKSPAVRNPITLSQQVAQLKEARVHADYHFGAANLASVPAPDWRKFAEDNVALASQLLPIVRRLPIY